MGYFNYIADQSFKTDANGDRLFFQNGPLFRAYILPDAATEERVRGKLKWLLRGLIFGIVLMPFLTPERLTHNALIFPGIIIAYCAIYYLINRLVLAPELRGLKRTSDRALPLA